MHRVKILIMKCLQEGERFSDEEDNEANKPDGASCASNKAKPDSVNHRPVVFVLEDFDMFSSQVLEDLIVSLK